MNCEKQFETRQDTTCPRQRVPLIWADCVWKSEILRTLQVATALRASPHPSLNISGRHRAFRDLREVRVPIR
jgi:hypothetical protein